MREVTRMNVSMDKPVCILLKFTYTNTETRRRLNVLTTVVMWWNIHMLETEPLQSDTPNLEEQNVKFCINPNLYSLCCLNWH